MSDWPTIEELKKAIAWSIEQGGNDNYLLNDNGLPYIWGYYLHVVTEQRGPVLKGQTRSQLFAFLEGKPQPTDEELPSYNIDWDIRNQASDSFCTLKQEDGSTVTMMGTFDFDTAEQGAERWLAQIKERTAKGLWTTNEERHARDKEIKKEFQDYFDTHCSDDGDCEWKGSCEVRWPGGHGLRGCRRENSDDEEMWKNG